MNNMSTALPKNIRLLEYPNTKIIRFQTIYFPSFDVQTMRLLTTTDHNNIFIILAGLAKWSLALDLTHIKRPDNWCLRTKMTSNK